MNTLAQKTNQAFYYLTLATTAFAGLLIFLIVEFSQKIYIYSGIVIHQLRTACNCPAMAKFNDHPFIFTTLGITGSAILFFIGFAIYRFFSLLIQTRKYVGQYQRLVRNKHSMKLKNVLSQLNLNPRKIIEISSSEPAVFCFGLLKTKIIIAHNLVNSLSPDELSAVLRHENYHLITHEPLKLFLLKYWQSLFFFLPGMKNYLKKYLTFSELAADEQATNNFTNRIPLASALLKITTKQEQGYEIRKVRNYENKLAVSYFSALMEERVNCLVNKDYQPKFGWLRREFFVGIFAVTITVMLSFVFLSHSDQALAMHDITSCTNNQTVSQTTMTCHQPNADYFSGLTCHMR